MRIIVSDTSCIIDLRKADLLEALLALPYTFVMPDALFEDELLSLTPAEKNARQGIAPQLIGARRMIKRGGGKPCGNVQRVGVVRRQKRREAVTPLPYFRKRGLLMVCLP